MLPVCCLTLPESDSAISTTGHHPGVGEVFHFGAYTDISIQAKAQQQATQQCGMVLTITLVTGKRTNKQLPFNEIN